jgi:hypothetical protein
VAVDLIGGQRHRAKKPRMTVESRQAILDAERVLIDEDRPEALKAEGVPLEDSLMGIPPPVSTAGSSSRRPHEWPGTSDTRSRRDGDRA